MAEEHPTPAAEHRANAGCGIAVLVIGLLVLMTSGLCTGLFVWGSGGAGEYAPVAWILGGPFILVGAGAAAFGMRLWKGKPGPAPLWQVIIGWLLMAFAALAVVGAIAGTGMAIYQAATSQQPVGILVVSMVTSLIIPLGLTGLVGWMGFTLTRPKP